MKKKHRILLVIFFITGINLLSCTLIQQSIIKEENVCEKWHSLIDPEVQNQVKQIDTIRSEREIFEAIECLLKFKGDKRISKLPNVYDPGAIARLYPYVTFELGALYEISAIYLKRQNFAIAVGIIDFESGKNTPDIDMEKAYRGYERWFNKIKRIGLKEARKQKLDPLEGTGLYWDGAYRLPFPEN